MSKITFRADDDLVDRLEALDGSKSAIMREALREYLDALDDDSAAHGTVDDRSLDELVAGRVDEFIDRRLADRGRSHGESARDVNVNVTVEHAEPRANATENSRSERASFRREPPRDQSRLCRQCGEPITDTHVFCPNCGEKAAHRVFCECGDEIRSDWAYCPRCGRRTASADVLDRT